MAETAIAKAGASLATLDEEQFAMMLAGINTDEQAAEFLSQLKEASNAVKHLKRLQHLRRKFAILENKAYLDLYQRGYEPALRELSSSLPPACKWALQLADEERDRVITGEDGSLVSQYTKARKAKRQAEAREDIGSYWLPKVRKAIIKEYESQGTVNISSEKVMHRHPGLQSELEKIPSNEANSLLHDFLDGTKDVLLQRGAYGIGEGEYVTIKNEHALRRALEVRFKSVSRDIYSISRIVLDAEKNGIEIEPFYLDGVSQTNRNLSPESSAIVAALLDVNTRAVCKWEFTTDKVREYALAAFLDILGIECAWQDIRPLLAVIEKNREDKLREAADKMNGAMSARAES